MLIVTSTDDVLWAIICCNRNGTCCTLICLSLLIICYTWCWRAHITAPIYITSVVNTRSFTAITTTRDLATLDGLCGLVKHWHGLWVHCCLIIHCTRIILHTLRAFFDRDSSFSRVTSSSSVLAEQMLHIISFYEVRRWVWLKFALRWTILMNSYSIIVFIGIWSTHEVGDEKEIVKLS